MTTTRTQGLALLLFTMLGPGRAVAGDGVILTTECVTDGLDLPVIVTAPQGDATRLFVVEVEGRIRIVDSRSGIVRPEPFLDISEHLGAGKLLGLTFDPAWTDNGFFYVNYSAGGDDQDHLLVIARYTIDPRDPDRADADSGQVVLSFEFENFGHQGGWVGFGPDGYLYTAFGNGGADPCRGLALDGDHHLGRILRLDPHGDDFPADETRNYAIPPDNPFVGGDVNEETWVHGLRQPWGVSFDTVTGDLYIGDVGSVMREELNVVPAGSGGGQDFGFPCVEGTAPGFGWCFPDGCDPDVSTPPLHEYEDTGERPTAIIGGVVYRGAGIPALQGTYLFADLVESFWSFRLRNGVMTEFVERTAELDPHGPDTLSYVSCIGTDGLGEVFVVEHEAGVLWRIVEDTCPQDTDGDGTVDVGDLIAVILAWSTDDTDADVDHDGVVDAEDLVRVVTGWGPCP